MSIGVLFAGGQALWREYEATLRLALEGLDTVLAPEMTAKDVDYIVFAPDGPVSDFGQFPQLKAVLNLWAGVEGIVNNPTLHVPLCRMVDPGLTEGMVEWVTGHVLRRHLGMDAQLQDGLWRNEVVPPLARDRSVCVLGLGALGAACAEALKALNFDVHGWSRRPKQIVGVTGHSQLEDALAQAEILVLLLPLTQTTTDLLDAARLARLPQGAHIINPGRGGLILEADLLAALDRGHVGSATLDVFRTEPLPSDHPFWAHPNITVTPHIASATRVSSASRVIAENIQRGMAGQPFKYIVDRAAGY